MRYRYFTILTSAMFLLCIPALVPAETTEHRLRGRAMGTTYNIKVLAPATIRTTPLKVRIDALLEHLTRSMSTYLEESEISRFNRLTETARPFAISEDFLKVMLAATDIHRLTQGAWDGTVDPLVNLWGFGRAGPIDHPPPRQEIEQALALVGFNLIEVSPRGYLRKRLAQVTVDLASIAKGYGVDRVARLLKDHGYADYLVELGGEVFAAGRRLDGKAWKVGINRPEKTAAASAVYKALFLEDRAMATSGDYRNFARIGDRFYSHIIDPRSGYPVSHGVVSATVVAPNCTLADGLATALMVLDAFRGVALLNSLAEIEGLIIVRRPDGELQDYWSRGLIDRGFAK